MKILRDLLARWNPPRRRSQRRSLLTQTQLPRLLKRIYIAAGVLLLLIMVGTTGFYYLDNQQPNISDALFMTLITITTVGYGEVVRIDTLGERIFAGVMAIIGFGVLTFLFTSLTVFFLETDLDLTLRRRRMERAIHKLRNHYIICGFGRVGRNVARELSETHRRFVAIDMDEAAMEDQRERFPGLLYLQGDGSDDDLLEAADIADAAGVFAVTGDDSRNLMIVFTAKQINPNLRVVARCQELRNAEKMRKAGADAVISPDFTGGFRIAASMVRPHVVSFLDEMIRSERHLRLEEVRVPDRVPPRPLDQIALRTNDYVFLAVRDADKEFIFNPPKNYILTSGQTLIAMCSPQGRHELETALASQE